MSVPDPVRRNSHLLWAIFLSALMAHAWLVTRNLTVPYMPGHEFRQSQTAITTYYIDQQNNFGLLYETPILGKPWVSILMEVPIYEWSVVGMSRALQVPHYVGARIVSLACFYLALPALYLLLGRCGLARPRRLLPLALVLMCPVYIFYSRAFLMDSMAFMFSAWFLYAYVWMMDRRRWYWFLMASVAGTGAALVKSATLAIWLWPAAAYAAWRLWCDLRTRAGWRAFFQTVFWGFAGVVVPLGALRLWIELTDPIKEQHASAWIFTSANLSLGNWGLNDIGARFSPKIWHILSERWSEAIMPPWLLLTLLVVGLATLPKVRWPALALAAIFFWAQLLFPYAYAYQDYYFYSCAVFLCAGLGVLALGLLDSPCPRWLAFPLIAAPFLAQFNTYRGFYQPQQYIRSEGGFSFTIAMREFLPKDTVIVVAGADWAGMIPFYSQRKALMVRNGLENDAAYLDRAFRDLADEEVGALVLVGTQLGNMALVERAAAAFDLELRPTAHNEVAQIYCAVRYRDSFKKGLSSVGNYDLINEPVPEGTPVKEHGPVRVRPLLAQTAFPGISPGPVRANFEQGLGYLWINQRKVIFAHPESDLWIRAPHTASHIHWEFGFVSDAYERTGDKTNGVELTVTGIGPVGIRRMIYRRYLDPVREPADRGHQMVAIPYLPLPGEILHFYCGPGENSAFDWVYWARIEIK